MKYKFALLTLITLLLIINGCSSQPSLLHQRTSTNSPGEEIWIMDDNGKNAQLIIKGTLPQWIWGGRSHIAYFVPGKPCDPSTAAICGTIYIADWDQNTQSIIGTPKAISGPDSGEHFAWSRDGQWIVFESFRDGNWEIYKVRRDGMGATNLTNNPSMDIEPDWTHDGSKNGKIAFVSDRTKNKDIFVINENGGNLVNLTKNITDLNNKPDDGDDWRPMWAANADLISFQGTHKAWGNFTPMVYLISISDPSYLGIVSDPTTGGAKLLGWEGSETIFYTSIYSSSKGIYRFDVKTVNRSLITNQYSPVGDQYDIGPKFLFIGTNKGLKAIEWNYTNKVKSIGPGINPDH